MNDLSIDTSPGESSSEHNPINAGIRKTLATLFVTNRDSFTWTSAEIFVNGIMKGYQYEYKSNIEPGETIELELISFTKRNGDRFQPFMTDVVEVIVSVPNYDSPIYNF